MGTFSSTMRWTPFEVPSQKLLPPSSQGGGGERRRNYRKGHSMNDIDASGSNNTSSSSNNNNTDTMNTSKKNVRERTMQKRSLSTSHHLGGGSAKMGEKDPSQSLIMGASAPMLYEQALVGQWEELIQRSKTHPSEAMYTDRCRNTAMHLACRRQPSAEVVTSLLLADPMAFQRTTIDGLTPLHFAAYCGAKTDVVEILLQEGKQQQQHPLTDCRGRTPLHCACAGFRTSHRPAVVQLLLEAHPGSANMPDERNRTPFTLMMEDYAEEVEEALLPSTSPRDIWINRIVPLQGDLHECWEILTLLLQAAHLGSVPEKENPATIDSTTLVAQFYNSMDKKMDANTTKNGDPNTTNLDGPVFTKVTSNSLLHQSASTLSARLDEIDLNNVPFRPVHAIAACAGSDETFPAGFVKLVLKLYAPLGGTKEEDEELNLPLHIAARANKYFGQNYFSSSSVASGWNQFSLIRKHGSSTHANKNNSRQNLSKSGDVYNADFGHNRQFSYHHFNKDYRHNTDEVNNNSSQKSIYNPTSTTIIVTMKKEQSRLTRNTIIEDLIKLCPQAAAIRDETGKYPLTLAIETGKPWKHAVEPMFRAFPDAFTSRGSTLQSTFMDALANPHQEIRDETARTLGELFRNWPISTPELSTAASSMEDMKLADVEVDGHSSSFSIDEENSAIMAPYCQFDNHLERPDADHFITSLIEMSVTNRDSDSDSFSYYDHGDDESGGQKRHNSFAVQVQVSMLQALFSALSNVPKEAIKIPETPEKALNSCIELLKYHPDESVRDGAARVIGSAVTLIGEIKTLHILHSLIPLNDHFFSSKVDVKHTQHNFSGSISSLDVSIEDLEELNDMNIVLHGKAAACYRILSSPVCDRIVSREDEKEYFCGLTSILKDWMVDAEAVMVRKAACLALGPILGYGLTQLKEVKHTILKCMRATEDAEVHIFLARGLMVAARKRPKLFICKHGTPVLDGALMLAMSAPIAVQKMFHGFLWIALGIDQREELSSPSSTICRDYVSEYMTLAEGENGRIMMSLITKTLRNISSVKDVW